MALIIDGTEIPEDSGEVIMDGVSVDTVIMDGTTVWQKYQPANFDYLYTNEGQAPVGGNFLISAPAGYHFVDITWSSADTAAQNFSNMPNITAIATDGSTVTIESPSLTWTYHCVWAKSDSVTVECQRVDIAGFATGTGIPRSAPSAGFAVAQFMPYGGSTDGLTHGALPDIVTVATDGESYTYNSNTSKCAYTETWKKYSNRFIDYQIEHFVGPQAGTTVYTAPAGYTFGWLNQAGNANVSTLTYNGMMNVTAISADGTSVTVNIPSSGNDTDIVWLKIMV